MDLVLDRGDDGWEVRFEGMAQTDNPRVLHLDDDAADADQLVSLLLEAALARLADSPSRLFRAAGFLDGGEARVWPGQRAIRTRLRQMPDSVCLPGPVAGRTGRARAVTGS